MKQLFSMSYGHSIRRVIVAKCFARISQTSQPDASKHTISSGIATTPLEWVSMSTQGLCYAHPALREVSLNSIRFYVILG